MRWIRWRHQKYRSQYNPIKKKHETTTYPPNRRGWDISLFHAIKRPNYDAYLRTLKCRRIGKGPTYFGVHDPQLKVCSEMNPPWWCGHGPCVRPVDYIRVLTYCGRIVDVKDGEGTHEFADLTFQPGTPDLSERCEPCRTFSGATT